MKDSADDRDSSAQFVRGLTLGALLGAIVAGSSLWRKSKSRRGAVRPTPASQPDRDPGIPGKAR